MVVMITQQLKVLNATELMVYLKVVKMINFILFIFTTVKNKF